MTKKELREFLDVKACQYESSAFIDSDPVAIPHRFAQREDIEIAGFLTATIAWGNRKSILKSGARIMELLDGAPAQFVRQHEACDRRRLGKFVHRTFNGQDLQYFVQALQQLYLQYGNLENAFAPVGESAAESIADFRQKFLALPHPVRLEKHLSQPLRGSSAKRLNMFLRWMVRPSATGVDFGLWRTWTPARLSCPLDVHSGRVARKLGLLQRKTNDAKAVVELDRALRSLDPKDPVKYDFALFGLGVFERF